MKRDKNNEEHALVPSVLSSEVSRYSKRNEARIANLRLFAITSPSRFLVSFYLVSQGVSSLYQLVSSCRIRYVIPSGFTCRVLFTSVSSFSRRTRYRHRPIRITLYIHRILVSLYLYIFYIHRIHHIHYIHQSTSHATITKQAAVPPPVPFASNRISGTRQER